ncbi:MAG: nucleotide pyrophosphohydrolase, partial [Bacteroidetes bacterium]|nr:nucleotide pyrophosphohydrolase [Bacteroidota bacterium]
MTNTKNLMSEISQFVEERDWNQFHSPKNLSMALGIEVVEQQEHFQ